MEKPKILSEFYVDELSPEELQTLKKIRETNEMLFRLQGEHVPTEEERRQLDLEIKDRLAKQDKIDSIIDTIRDIIVTPLSPIFHILTIISKCAIYIFAVIFLYACYKIYKNTSAGLGIWSSIVTDWKYLIAPLFFSIVYFICDKCREYCSFHSLMQRR